MPTIKQLGSCKICMYFADHGPPHFHIVSPDGDLVLRLSDLRIVEGDRRRIDTRDALAWASSNKERLMAKWEELHR